MQIGKLKFIAFTLLIILLLNQPAFGQTTSIIMIHDGNIVPGEAETEFAIVIEIDSATDFIGVSFNIEWDKPDFVEGSNIIVGNFLGSNPLKIDQYFDDKIEVGVSRTSGGADGSGRLVECIFNIKQDVQSGVPVNFYLNNIVGLNSHGDSISISESDVLTILLEKLTDINDEIVPAGYKLYQNYPNPFNPVTTIKYSIPGRTFVSLKIQNIIGSEIANLFSGYLNPGYYDIEFNGSNIPSGIYFCELKTPDFVAVRKMILLK